MAHYICEMDIEPHMGRRVDIVFYAIKESGSMAVEETGWGTPVLYSWANKKIIRWMPLPKLPKEEKHDKTNV